MVGRPRSVSDAQIFRAVARTVAREGPAGLTLAAVAAKVGVTGPALAQRFGSKQKLLVAFAASEVREVSAVFERAAARATDPIDLTRIALSSLARGVSTKRALANHLAFLQLDLVNRDLRKHAIAQGREVRHRLSTLISQAIEQEILAETDASRLADMLFVTYNGTLVTWAMDGTGALADAIVRNIDDTLRPLLQPNSTNDGGRP